MTTIPPELKALNPKQRAFVLSYVKDKNATKAAKAAGYRGSDNSLAAHSSRLVRNNKIVAAIDVLTRPAVEEAMVSVEKVIRELSDIGFADWKEFTKIIFDRMGNEKEVLLQLKDKIAALKLLGDHVGAFAKSGDPDQQPRFQISANLSEDEAREALLSLLKKR